MNAFLANRLDPDARHQFVAHLGVCEDCAALLRDLREDERLARMPLTAEERSSILAIVGTARAEIDVRLENDRRVREEAAPAKSPAPAAAPLALPEPRLLMPAAGLRRVFWLAAAVAALLAAAGWWLFRT